ncbi:MAG: siphovirus Gp157 family protein [Phycisphaerae bacterium]|jgi:hypothetical protein
MNIYDVVEIENQIDRIAEANEGEIPDELLMELVTKQTESLVQIEKLCRYIRHLETFGEMCDAEIDRIGRLKSGAINRMKSIKRYLTPYVVARGKFDAGTFRLSTRKSTSVDIDADFGVPEFMRETVTVVPDKAKIKDAILGGALLPGARIVEKENLQIK